MSQVSLGGETLAVTSLASAIGQHLTCIDIDGTFFCAVHATRCLSACCRACWHATRDLAVPIMHNNALHHARLSAVVRHCIRAARESAAMGVEGHNPGPVEQMPVLAVLSCGRYVLCPNVYVTALRNLFGKESNLRISDEALDSGGILPSPT